MNKPHWALEYIGKPWRMGAVGPDDYDCLGFAAAIQRERFGVSMNVIDILGGDWKDPQRVKHVFEAHRERDKWFRVDEPEEGDLILMAFSRLPVHIGVWINANGTRGALHCAERVGVVFQTLSSLRRVGWGSFSYFRRTKCN